MGTYRIRKTKKRHRTHLMDVMRARKITLKELQEISGVDFTTLSRIRTGRKDNINMDTAKKICNALKLSLNDVFGEIKKYNANKGMVFTDNYGLQDYYWNGQKVIGVRMVTEQAVGKEVKEINPDHIEEVYDRYRNYFRIGKDKYVVLCRF